MSKKMIFILIIIILMVFGIFIYGELQYRKVVISDNASNLEKADKTETKEKEPEQIQTKQEPAQAQKEEPKVQSLEQISLEELKQKGAKKKEEEFDLTPSIDDLIKMEKERRKAY